MTPEQEFFMTLHVEGRERIVQDFEIIDHGVDYPDYFQGCGVAFTRFADVATGVGENAREAYEDALEQLACGGWNTDKAPKRPKGISVRNRVNRRVHGEEAYYYVSVRVV